MTGPELEPLPTLSRADRRRQERAAAKAVAQTRASGSIEDALALSQARDSIKGAYGVIRVLVEKLGGGPIVISRGEWVGAPPNRHLTMRVDDNGDVQLEVESRK